MCLNIYTKKEDIPFGMKFVDYNDLYFNAMLLQDNKVSREILKAVDNAEYNSPNTFVGRDKALGSLNKALLSTGCKTLLNIAGSPDVCFDVIECGQNALALLPFIKHGNVLWQNPSLHLIDDRDCNVCVDGKRFFRFSQVLKYLMD